MRLLLVLLIAGCATRGVECTEGEPATDQRVQPNECIKVVAYQPNEILGIEADPDSCSPDPGWCDIGLPGNKLEARDDLRFEITHAMLNADGSCPLSCN
jgi:hypothetical protein